MKRLIVMLSCCLTLTACGGGGGGGSNQGGQGPITLSAPTGVVVTSSASKNTISWQAVNGATSYNLYWSTSPNVTKSTGSKIINASSPFVHTGLVDTQKYYYVVTSLKDSAESDMSIELDMSASKIVSLDAGKNGVIALKSDGSVWTWNDSTSIGSHPVKVPGLTSVTAVAINHDYANYGDNYLALKSDGTLWAWGDNHYGQLGDGTTVSSTTPVQVNISDVIMIRSSGLTSFVLKRDGTVWAWGYNGGALGYDAGQGDFKSSPVQIPNLSNIVHIASNKATYYAVKSDGTLWVWGSGFSVAGTTVNALPGAVPGLNNVLKIMAPYWLEKDGSLWAWNSSMFGSDGLLKSNTNSTITVPTKLVIDNVMNVSLNWFTFVKSDGTAWLAARDANSVFNITKVNPYDDAISTVSSDKATYVLRRDGTIVGWELFYPWNDNSYTTYLSPFVVSGI